MTLHRHPRADGRFELTFSAGINDRDPHNISQHECQDGWNFLLNVTSRDLQPRPPQTLKGTAPNGGQIQGICQMIERDDTQSQIVCAGDTVYKWNGASTWSDITPPVYTSVADETKMRSEHWALDEWLCLVDVGWTNNVLRWDGETIDRWPTGILAETPQSVTSITCSGTTATVNQTSHGHNTGDLVKIAGANESVYNGQFTVTVSDANTYTYTVSSCPGSATGTLTAARCTPIKAKYARVKDNRLWLFGIKADSTEQRHMILVSEYEDGGNFDNSTAAGESGLTGNEAFYILTPDLKAINGVEEFFNTLIVSTENGKIFRITGDDSTNYSVDDFYPGSAAMGYEAMVNIGDDVLFVRNGGLVESLTSTDRYGDVSTDDVSYWIGNTVKNLESPTLVYDQTNQRIYLFDEGIEGMLVLDKEFWRRRIADETGPLSPWGKWICNLPSKFDASCAVQLRVPDSATQTVYWGDDDGRIYDINGSGIAGDDGDLSISMYRRSRIFSDTIDSVHELTTGRVVFKRNYALDMELQFNWLDSRTTQVVVIPLKGAVEQDDAHYWGEVDLYWGEAKYWNAGRIVEAEFATMGFTVPGKEVGFYVDVLIGSVYPYNINKVYV